MSNSTNTLSPEAFASIDRQFARFIRRLSDVPEAALAAALASYELRKGHICLDLELEPEMPPECAQELGLQQWPKPSTWVSQLRASDVVGTPGEFKPLILDPQNRLYLHRYWKYETELAQTILRLAREEIPQMDPQRLGRGIKRLFPNETKTVDWQAVAAFAACRKRLCIISGGPGTGKTRTVVLTLLLLLEQNPNLRIALAAPTGKAAARLQESIRKVQRALQPAPAVDKQAGRAVPSAPPDLPDEVATIHRLLGSVPDSAFFRHDATHPLPFDLVVIDEASMVDLALMAKLLAALPDSARLILLGDKDQLASVEAGAVLGDLCNGGEPCKFSAAFANDFAALTGQQLPAETVEAKPSALTDCIVELKKNYRFGEESGIYRLSQAVNRGDASAALQVLRSTTSSPQQEFTSLLPLSSNREETRRKTRGSRTTAGAEPQLGSVTWKSLPAPGDLKALLAPLVLAGYQSCLSAGSAAEALSLFAHFRILCAVRHGPYGVENLNRLTEEILREAGLLRAETAFYHGRPLMVLKNDYNLKLFNGDIGVVLERGAQEMRACFPGPDDTVREYVPLRLPEHATAFAMTVHKAQGSEFERVLLLLPGEANPVLTQELVYTGLTRAGKHVELWAGEAQLQAAIQRKLRRRSGLRDSIWAHNTA